jgi:hypothetical protein
MPAPVLAAPLVIPFAEAIGVSIAALGMAKATDKVNEFIQENPEDSIKIFQMIMPSQGIANALKNKSSEGDEEVSEDIDVEVEEKPKKLTGREKGMRIKEAIRRARAGRGNYSSPDAEGPAVDIRGSVIREVEDMGIADKDLKDNYDPTKPKFDYKKFFKKRYADGGAIGIEVLFGEKNPRQGLFMGGSPLEGQALNIYNSMNAYGFDDQAIADALSAQGLYTAGGTTDTPDTTIQPIGFQSSNGGGGGGITELNPLNRPKGTPFDLNSLTKTKFGYNNALGRTIEGVKDFTGSMIDKFSGSKIGEGITSGATKFKNMAFTPMMALMQKRNPLNPSATNYNPNLQKQMDFLEGTTGTRVFGTSDNLQFEDAAMIGRDPNSGLAKYGPGSVLSGQNVVSGFGTNDYEQQLANYVEKMRNRAITKTLTKFQQQKLDAAMAELGREKARQEKDAADRARAANADVYAELDKKTGGKGYGDAGGFSTSKAGKEGAFGTFGEGRGRKDFSEGGLVTMFKEKR